MVPYRVIFCIPVVFTTLDHAVLVIMPGVNIAFPFTMHNYVNLPESVSVLEKTSAGGFLGGRSLTTSAIAL